jgi:hypothetical protein
VKGRAVGQKDVPFAGPASESPRFFDGVKNYKELLLFVGALASAWIFFHDYFATRREVRILKCQSDAQIDLLKSRMEMERSSAMLLTSRIPQQAAEKAALPAGGNATTDSDHVARVHKDKLSRQLVRAEADEANALDRLKPGHCDEWAKKG